MCRDEFCDPRQQVAGAIVCYVPGCLPEFDFGIPIPGRRDAQVSAFLGNPPRYESQATYLKRHGLLTGEESTRLPKEAFRAEAFQWERYENRSWRLEYSK